MLKIGVIGVPGGWSSELLADAVADKTKFRMMIDMEKVMYNGEENTLYYDNTDLSDLDGLIIKKIGAKYSPHLMERLELLKVLESRKVKIFSAPSNIMNAVDRLSNTTTLRIGGIPMPPTIITENIDQAVSTVKLYGTAVVKPLYSSKARGMHLFNTDDPELLKKMKHFKYVEGNTAIYLQKKIEIPGKDLGVAFLGGKYVGTYARVGSKESWNTTTLSGGKYQPFEPSKDIIDLAKKAQSLFKLDFTCVDVVETDQGPMVFEVSAFGGFRGLKEALDIDIAAKYIDYVVKKVKK